MRTKIGKYFTLAELTKTSQPYDNTPNSDEIVNLTKLTCKILDPLREAYGKPIIVNSAFRSEKVNSAVGGVKTSQHRTGHAADIVPQDRHDIKLLFQLIQGPGLPFDQLILEGPGGQWIHVSYDETRNRRQVLTVENP